MTSLSNANAPINEANRENRADIALVDPQCVRYIGFDADVALELAELLQKTYKRFDQFLENKTTNTREQTLPQLNLGGDYQLVSELYEDQIPFGFVASKVNSNDIFVAFRGTKIFTEWFQDANIPLVSYSDGTNRQALIPNTSSFGRVTVGFRKIYTALRQTMIAALNRCNQDSRIFVTGHSLGGALATLAIPDILSNTHFSNPGKVVLYTFASPRCGDREFAIKFRDTDVKHWRIANTEDIVTMIPFPTGNIFQPASSETPPELDVLPENPEVGLGIGGVTGTDRNPNPLFGFFKAMYDRNKRRMPDYVHTGTPVYFTIHAAALERHHNLEEIYMRGILRFRD